jgi:uncharacterized protein
MTSALAPGSQRFFGIAPAPGSKQFERVEIGQFADASPITIPVAVIEGANPGPSLYVQAGIHGDEFTGTDMAWRLIQSVDPAQLSGTLVVVPIGNTPSYLTRARGFLLEERYLQDANRLYPGKAGGLLTERIVAALFNSMVMHADLTVDIHCPLDGSSMVPFMHVGTSDDDDGWLDRRKLAAEAFGLPYHYYRIPGVALGSSDMTRSLAHQAGIAKRAVVMAELGTSRQIDRQAAIYGAEGLLRIMAAMGMWNAPLPASQYGEPTPFSNIALVYANAGGGLRMNVELGQVVCAGDSLGVILDAFGAETEVIVAPVDGFIMRVITFGAVATGAEVAWIGN